GHCREVVFVSVVPVSVVPVSGVPVSGVLASGVAASETREEAVSGTAADPADRAVGGGRHAGEHAAEAGFGGDVGDRGVLFDGAQHGPRDLLWREPTSLYRTAHPLTQLAVH